MFFGCSPCCGSCIVDYDKFKSFHIEATARVRHSSYSFVEDYTFPGIDVEIPIVADFNRTGYTDNGFGEIRESYFADFSYDAGTRNDRHDGEGANIPVSLVGHIMLRFHDGRTDQDQVLDSYEIGLLIQYDPFFPGSELLNSRSGYYDNLISFRHSPCGLDTWIRGLNTLITVSDDTGNGSIFYSPLTGGKTTIVSFTSDSLILSPGQITVLTRAPFYGRPNLLIQGDPTNLTRSHIYEEGLFIGGILRVVRINVEISLSVETAIGINDDGTFEPLSPYWFA